MKIVVVLIVVLIVLVVLSYNRVKKSRVYLFGYGSLLNPTLQRIFFPDRKPTRYPVASLLPSFGMSRWWFQMTEGGLMLGIVPSEQPREINGIVIPVDESDLRRIDVYEEATHYRQQVPVQHIESAELSPDSVVYVYLPKTTTLKPASLLQRLPDFYVQTVVDGFAQYGEDEVTKLFKTTRSKDDK